MPSATAPPGTGPFRRLAPSEHLGRKGRSLPGSHRPKGFLALAGPSISNVGEIEADMQDVTATLLHRAGVSVPGDASGRVLWEALEAHAITPNVDHGSELPALESEAARIPKTDGVRAYTKGVVEARLRALGYID